MDSFFARYKNPLVLIALLLAQIIGLAVQVRRPSSAPDGHHVRLVRLWAASLAFPVEKAVHSVGHDFGRAWSDYIDLRGARRQNRELQQRVGQLQQEEVKLAEDAQQGHRLQALVQFQQQYVGKTVAAQVIGTSGSDLSRVLYIDKGSADGLFTDVLHHPMAVITPDGVVGRVREVFPHEAQVLVLNDPNSGAGVVLASSRIRAILRGTPTGKLVIDNLTQDNRIQPGEQVITSGGDQVFPRGLTVGTIESIKPDPVHQPYTTIVVQPAAKLDQLDEVLVVTATQSTMPAQMQQDLTAATNAADAARTATAAAERLPEINEPGSEAPAAGANGVPAPAALPKPVPTIHPDRFTPGVTPPAASLTPGGANGVSGAASGAQGVAGGEPKQ